MICPYCKEEIADGAIKCKHCQSMLDSGGVQKDPLLKIKTLIFSSEGRLDRKSLWLFSFITLAFLFILRVLLSGLIGNSLLMDIETKRAIDCVPLLVGILVMYNPLVKRCHDRGVGKWPALIFSIAMVVLGVILANQDHGRYSLRDVSSVALVVVSICWTGIIGLFIEFYCMPGTIGDNKYGKNPLGVAKAESKSKPSAHQKITHTKTDKRIFARITGILFSPTKEWAKIAAEEHSARKLFFCWVLPFLAAIVFYVIVVGNALTERGDALAEGWDVRADAAAFAAKFFIMYGIGFLFFALVTLFAITCITNFLAPKCGGQRDWSRSFVLAAYSMTPMWLACVLYSIPIPYVGLLCCIAPPVQLLYFVPRRPSHEEYPGRYNGYVLYFARSYLGGHYVCNLRHFYHHDDECARAFLSEMIAPQAADTFRAGVATGGMGF
jgi:uncharacterized membrane protein YhaH (DUF805 family)